MHRGTSLYSGNCSAWYRSSSSNVAFHRPAASSGVPARGGDALLEGEELQGLVPAGNQETPRIPKKEKTPVLNGIFNITFPNGVRQLEVARDGYCGLYAIIKSYKAQYPHHPPPTVEALLDALKSRAMGLALCRSSS